MKEIEDRVKQWEAKRDNLLDKVTKTHFISPPSHHSLENNTINQVIVHR